MLVTPETAAVGAVLLALQGSNLPLRQPSWNAPSFWSRPLFVTNMLPIPSGADWTQVVRLAGRPNYIGLVSHYVATSVGSLAIAGLEFRMLLNGAPLPASAVVMAAGVELNKESGTTYPVIPRKLFQPVLQGQTLEIQCRNPTGLQRAAVGAFYGWFYDTIDANTFSASEFLNPDSTYRGQVGTSYG